MKKFVCSGGRISEEMLRYYKNQINYSTVMKLLRKKDVKINGKRIGSDVKTESGDVAEVYFDGIEKSVTVCFSDENVLCAYKPKGESSEDFFERVRKEYPSAAAVHRLDTNTDGLVLFALCKEAEEELLKAFKERTIEKFYVAEVYGKMETLADELRAYLKKDEKLGEVKISDKKEKGFAEIVTRYKVLEERENSSVVEVELVTGKTHQIRAHLAHEGHFIIGDGKYGKESINRKFSASKQRLTAYRIIFKFKEGEKLRYLNGKEVLYDKKY